MERGGRVHSKMILLSGGQNGAHKKGQIVLYFVFQPYLTTLIDTTGADSAQPYFRSFPASQVTWSHFSRILGCPVWPHLSQVVGFTNTYILPFFFSRTGWAAMCTVDPSVRCRDESCLASLKHDDSVLIC